MMRLIGLLGVCLLIVGGVLAQGNTEPTIKVSYKDIGVFDTEIAEWFQPDYWDFYGAKFSPNNTQLVLWGDGSAYIYNLTDEKFDSVIRSLIDYPEAVAWNADGTLLLVPDGLYDVATNTRVTELRSPLLNLWSTQNASLYFAENKIWQVGESEPLRVFDDEVMAVTPDLSRVLTRAHDDQGISLHLRDVPNRVDLGSYSSSDFASFVPSLFSPDLTQVILQDCCQIRVADLTQGEDTLNISLISESAEEIYVDPMTGEELSPEMGGIPFSVWQADMGMEMGMDGCGGLSSSLVWSPDSKHLLHAGSVYDVDSGTEMYQLSRPGSAATWTDDGTRLITSSGIWDAATGESIVSFDYGSDLVEWREDTRRILIWSVAKRQVTILDAEGRVLLQAEHSGADSRWCGGPIPKPPAWSDDGRLLATWGDLLPRLTIGQNATVYAQNDTLNLRSQPNTSARIVEELLPQTEVTLLEGPQENEGFAWWRVQLVDGREGWVVESADGIKTLTPRYTDDSYIGAFQIWSLP